MNQYEKFTPCKNNENVHCPYEERRCDKCGWNPKVAAARLDKIRKKKGAKA